MQRPGRRCFAGFLVVALIYIIASGIILLATSSPDDAELEEEADWIATSRHWIDRQLCGWFGLCGTYHLNSKGWTWETVEDDAPELLPSTDEWWTSGAEDPDSWSKDERDSRKIPQYVFDYAPYVHLFSGEEFWPCDLADHLIHTSPRVNYTKILDLEYDVNLTNLHDLDAHPRAGHGRYMYLTSDENVEERPDWLGGAKNIPVSQPVVEDDDTPWPEPGDGDDFEDEIQDEDVDESEFGGRPSPESIQNLLKEQANMMEDANDAPLLRSPSTNGRCGGSSGFTCTGSGFGKCCSIYGWCGSGQDYCGDPCDAMAGNCHDPFEPIPRPHVDLRRRRSDSDTTNPRSFGRSRAPAILITVPKPDGILDAFWFFFYSFNQGQKVFNIRFGNHVGDWEHTMIRFRYGKPESVFLSEHDFGDAYAWHALEKYLPNPDGSDTMLGTWQNSTASRLATRPVVYSAVGSHAMYASPGLHPYILPWGLLHDQTDRGPLWDPALNVRSYTWDKTAKLLRSSTRNPKAPVGWFHYAGHWGDKYYPLSDPRQYRFAGQYHYVNGPSGPKFKNLGRKEVCQGHGRCHVRNWLRGSRAVRSPIEEDTEEGGLPGGNMTDDTM